MNTFQLLAENREETVKAPQLLRKKYIPGTVYGHGHASRSLQMKADDFNRVLKDAGQTSLIDLTIGEEKTPFPVLIHQIQRNPLNDQVIHVEFYRVRLTEKLTTEIPIHLLGDPPALKLTGGILFHNLQEVEVECLPQDLVPHIDISLDSLQAINDAILVKDLPLPAGMTALTDPNEVVCKILPPRAEEVEEVAEEAEAAEAATPEVITEKKEVPEKSDDKK